MEFCLVIFHSFLIILCVCLCIWVCLCARCQFVLAIRILFRDSFLSVDCIPIEIVCVICLNSICSYFQFYFPFITVIPNSLVPNSHFVFIAAETMPSCRGRSEQFSAQNDKDNFCHHFLQFSIFTS